MSSRGRVVGYGLGLTLVVLGVLAFVLVRDGTGQVLGFVLVAFGFVLATSLVFYEVGVSEDRARARDQRARSAPRARRPFHFRRERDHSRRPR